MKNILFLSLLLMMLSCKRECDCQQEFNDMFYTEQVDLPVKDEIQEPSEFDLAVYIEEDNSLKLDETDMTIEQIDSSIVATLENNQSPTLKVFPHPKSNFDAFFEVLKLTRLHDLKIVIGQ